MKTILFIDKSEELSNFVKSKDESWRILRADTVANATRMLDTEEIDIMVLELSIAIKAKLNLSRFLPTKIPVLLLSDNGKELINNYPEIPRVLKIERPIENDIILTTLKAVLENKSDTLKHLRNLITGELLFMEGEPPDCLYWLVTGELAVYTTVDGVEKNVGTVHKDEIVGEMAFLGFRARSATLRAQTSCQLLEIRPEKFTNIVDAQPAWFQSILRNMANRLLESNKKSRS